jgi:hypothetical protein
MRLHASFTPLVMSCNGGLGHVSGVFHSFTQVRPFYCHTNGINHTLTLSRGSGAIHSYVHQSGAFRRH